MASHHRGGSRGGGGRGQANPNVAQLGGYGGGRGGGRGGQYYGGHGGGGDRGGGSHQGGRDRGGGRGRGYNQGGGGGRGRGGYQEGRGGGYQGRGGRGGGQQGGSSGQHPVLRQATGPPLAERYAAQAAALKEKFKMMGIHRDAPMFPARPGFGTAGTPCIVRANHFFIGLVDKGLHHYDVSITPESTLKGEYRQVMSKLVSEHQRTELGGRLPAYDGAKSLFTAGELPFKSKEFDVTVAAGRAERGYKVAIKHATEVSLHQLMMLMAGRPTDVPAQALQVLDIVLRDIVLNERNEMGYVAVGAPSSRR